MAKNIKYQFYSAIIKNFNEGMDKYSDKKNGIRGTEKIYSYADRKNLIDFSANLANFLKENFHEVKTVKEITPGMVQMFLNTKAAYCSKNTIDQYVSKIKKLEQIVTYTYKTVNAKWSGDIKVPESKIEKTKIRDIVFEKNDLKSILNLAEKIDSKSQARIAVECASRFGMRVSETCKIRREDILDSNELHIHESKGGRSRDIPITNDDVQFLKNAFEGKGNDERLVQIKDDSVNRWLSRMEEKLGIREKYKDAKSGIHAIRKMVAQERYDQCRSEGNSIKEAKGKTSTYLGHGKNRNDLMYTYIANIR